MSITVAPLINGQSFDWQSAKFTFLGATFAGITAISYSRKQAKENNYGSGSEPVSRGRGRTEYEGGMTLEEVEVRRILQQLQRGQSLIDVPPFDVTVTWVVGTRTYTDILHMCEFVDEGIDVKEGDTTVARELELIIGGITFGKGA
ncbi:hypothetical protein BH09BAC1_BH09BAC1_04970 [soil metagenome]